jgi:transcription initiation factor IIF auxiliary subunit
VVSQTPFEIEESGWGEFETQITIYFVDPNEKPVFEICFLNQRILIELF